MNLSRALCLLLFAVAALSVRAEAIHCPDLSNAVQVGTCPAEEELTYTFTGYCSDNARMYRGDNDVCTDYRRYRELKNIVMWESADGAFHGYVSCDLPAVKLRQAKPVGMKVAKQGRITRLLCDYGEGLVFAHRTPAGCKIQGAGNCAADLAGCKADCN